MIKLFEEVEREFKGRVFDWGLRHTCRMRAVMACSCSGLLTFSMEDEGVMCNLKSGA